MELAIWMARLDDAIARHHVLYYHLPKAVVVPKDMFDQMENLKSLKGKELLQVTAGTETGHVEVREGTLSDIILVH